jgi:hypothetical protein
MFIEGGGSTRPKQCILVASCIGVNDNTGDRQAISVRYLFENNLMEEDPKNMLDPNVIDKKKFGEAQNVAFFQAPLWLNGIG